MSATRLNMTVQGTYESIAECFDAVCGLQAFIRPLSMQITPTREEGRTIVDADFGCDVMSFVLEDSLVELAGGSHAQP